jgi:hypothetical protein
MRNHSGKIKNLVLILFVAIAIGYFAFYLLRTIPRTPFKINYNFSDSYTLEGFPRSEDGFLFNDPFGDGDGLRGGGNMYMRKCKVKISGTITMGAFRFRVFDENQKMVCDYTLASGTYCDEWFDVGDLGYSYTIASGVSETGFKGSINFVLYSYNRKYEYIKASFPN